MYYYNYYNIFASLVLLNEWMICNKTCCLSYICFDDPPSFQKKNTYNTVWRYKVANMMPRLTLSYCSPSIALYYVIKRKMFCRTKLPLLYYCAYSREAEECILTQLSPTHSTHRLSFARTGQATSTCYNIISWSHHDYILDRKLLVRLPW